MIQVNLTGHLSDFTHGTRRVEIEHAEDVHAVIRRLDSKFPGIGQRILDDQDRIRVHVNVFVNSENARELGKERTKLRDGDVIHILPSVTGG